MNIIQWYFGFHTPCRPLAKDFSWYGVLGHVEAFGYTKDDTWLFFDPQGRGSEIRITHLHDEVEELMTDRYAMCETILRIAPPSDKLIIPLRGPTTCVSQCAGLLGWRAYTPSGFHRKLLKNGAEVIHGTESTRRKRRG